MAQPLCKLFQWLTTLTVKTSKQASKQTKKQTKTKNIRSMNLPRDHTPSLQFSTYGKCLDS